MTDIVIAPLLVALVTAILTLLTRRHGRLQRGASLAGVLAYGVAVAALFRTVVLGGGAGGRVLTYQVASWPAPLGIVLVADALAAFMLAISAIVSIAALAFSLLAIDEYSQRLSYHTLFHFMLLGITGSFLTGDIFNLFVWFEVMLMSSYVLVVFYSGPQHTRAALRYVVLNLIGSAIMLLAIGGIYSTTGTLNMADLARRLAQPAAYNVDVVPVLGLAGLLFAVFALKAGIAPFQFWVPSAYRAAPAPVTAVLAGVVKKVGVYAIIRLYFTVFSQAALPQGLLLPGFEGDSMLAFFGPVLFAMAAASAILGGIGAVGRDEIDELLAYSSIGQVGFIVLPLAIGATVPPLRELAVAATLVYAFNHGLSKGLLFLASGAVQTAVGSTRFEDLGGIAPRAPVLAGSFLLGALSLVGIPPLSGFFGKLLVFRTAAEAFAAGENGAAAALAVALVGAIFTIAYFSRAWNRVFWGEASELVATQFSADRPVATDGGTDETADHTRRSLLGQIAIVAVLALTVVGFGIGFEVVASAAETAARAALDTDGYVTAVELLEVNE